MAIAEGIRIAIDAVNAAGGVGDRPLRLLDAGRMLVTGIAPELLDNPEVHRTLLDLGREASA